MEYCFEMKAILYFYLIATLNYLFSSTSFSLPLTLRSDVRSIQITRFELQFFFFSSAHFLKEVLCEMKSLNIEKEEGQESMENAQAG